MISIAIMSNLLGFFVFAFVFVFCFLLFRDSRNKNQKSVGDFGNSF